MAYVYSVTTNKGTHDATVDYYHEHVTKADFERALLTALANLGANIVLHHYTFKARR